MIPFTLFNKCATSSRFVARYVQVDPENLLTVFSNLDMLLCYWTRSQSVWSHVRSPHERSSYRLLFANYHISCDCVVLTVAVANKKIIEEYSKSLQAAGLTVSTAPDDDFEPAGEDAWPRSTNRKFYWFLLSSYLNGTHIVGKVLSNVGKIKNVHKM